MTIAFARTASLQGCFTASTPALTGPVPREEFIVKSRERVRAYGEVFTPQHMVNQMLDLAVSDVEDKPSFVDVTFLEPSAGDGNFLIAILRRKLRAIERYIEPEKWTQESLFALASIYGIELLADNHADAQASMLEEFLLWHRRHRTVCHTRTNLYRAGSFLIAKNIVQGNTLTATTVNGEAIVFSWWKRTSDSSGMVLREPFAFDSLREAGMFSFAHLETYAPCLISQVHHERTADAEPSN